MPKGYWIVAHRRSPDEEKGAAYRKIVKPLIEAAGGRVLVMGGDPIAKEFGTAERVVVVEFPSHEAALAAYESEAYQRGLAVYGDGIERDFRIVEGLD
jgi:uncharacterized protein (DUF1330 family)